MRIAGLDLGQAQDPSALAMVERDQWPEGRYGPIDDRTRVVALRQWPLDTDYTELADEVLGYGMDALVVEVNGPGRPMLDLLRRQARKSGFKGRVHGTVTAPSSVRPKLIQDEAKGRIVVVPKGELIYAINELQRRGAFFECSKCGTILPAPEMNCPQTLRNKRTGELVPCPGKSKKVGGSLVVPEALETQWRMTVEQMKVFEQRQNDMGNISFGGRGKYHHCDLVIALGIACWWLNRMFSRRNLAIMW